MRRRGAFLLVLALFGTWLVAGVSPVAANRFGPPWMARVVADQSTVYAQPDARSGAPIGPLQHGAILIVTGQQTDDTGHEWTRTTLGYVASQDVVEYLDPWVADVTANSVPVYAKPNAGDAIRLRAEKGSLMRVAGVSPGHLQHLG